MKLRHRIGDQLHLALGQEVRFAVLGVGQLDSSGRIGQGLSSPTAVSRQARSVRYVLSIVGAGTP